MEQLKPCPFCGGEAHLKEIPLPSYPIIWIECVNCGAGFPEKTDKQEAIEAWNRRAE